MIDPAHLDDLERRAFRYDAQDGVMEFLVGVMFFFIARTVVDPHLAWAPALLVFPMRWASRFFKQRFTYPRIGYVKLRGEEASDLGWGMLRYLAVVVLIMAAGLWVFGDITSWSLWKRWLPGLMGAFCAGGFIYVAGKSGLWRHWLLVAISLGWGVACAVWHPGTFRLGLHRWALGLGAASLVMGVVTFLIFLRTHPVREQEVTDEQG